MILSFEEFVNESRGQSIRMRKTNKPFDPNNNQWTQARDSRKERAEELRRKKQDDALYAFLGNCREKILDIEKYGKKIESQCDIKNFVSRMDFYFYKVDDGVDTNTLFEAIFENGEFAGIKFDDDPKVYKDDDLEDLIDIDIYYSDDVAAWKDYCAVKTCGLWWYDEDNISPAPSYVVLDHEGYIPMVLFEFGCECPSGFDKYLNSKGYEVKRFGERFGVKFKLDEIDKFKVVLDKYFSKY